MFKKLKNRLVAIPDFIATFTQLRKATRTNAAPDQYELNSGSGKRHKAKSLHLTKALTTSASPLASLDPLTRNRVENLLGLIKADVAFGQTMYWSGGGLKKVDMLAEIAQSLALMPASLRDRFISALPLEKIAEKNSMGMQERGPALVTLMSLGRSLTSTNAAEIIELMLILAKSLPLMTRGLKIAGTGAKDSKHDVALFDELLFRHGRRGRNLLSALILSPQEIHKDNHHLMRSPVELDRLEVAFFSSDQFALICPLLYTKSFTGKELSAGLRAHREYFCDDPQRDRGIQGVILDLVLQAAANGPQDHHFDESVSDSERGTLLYRKATAI